MKTKLNTSLFVKNEFNVINNKPEYCVNSCRLASQSYGFVRDWVGKEPKLAVLGIVPTSGELAQGIWESDMFHYLLKTYFEPQGLTKENLVLSNVLRCQPKDKEPKDDHAYPREKLRKHAEATCRFHDIAFSTFRPEIYIASFDIYAIRKLDANKVLFKADVRKAINFINKGYKPCLLLGEEPLHLVAPHLGGVKTWRGHWWVGEWKWTAGQAQNLPEKPLVRKEWKIKTTKTNTTPKTTQLTLF